MTRYALKTNHGRLELMEDGVAVARVVRGRIVGRRFVEPPKAKFYTERARDRFDEFCDALSISEGLEALGAGAAS